MSTVRAKLLVTQMINHHNVDPKLDQADKVMMGPEQPALFRNEPLGHANQMIPSRLKIGSRFVSNSPYFSRSSFRLSSSASMGLPSFTSF